MCIRDRRVSLVRALVNNPEIIIADEPTGNVDPEMSHEIIELLNEINATGRHEAVDGGRRRRFDWPYPCTAALRPVRIMPQPNTTRRALSETGGRGKGGISF